MIIKISAEWQVAIVCLFLFSIENFLNASASETEISFSSVKEAWLEQGHKLLLVYSHEHVEFYHDVQHTSFLINSELDHFLASFRIARQLYHSTKFDKDFKLYMIHHKYCINHKKEIHNNVSVGRLNVIHCQEEYDEDLDIPCLSKSFFRKMIVVVAYHVLAVEDFHKHLKSHWRIGTLLWYHTWRQLKSRYIYGDSNLSWELPGENTELLRRWYIPIYEDYGGWKVVQRFVNVIKNLSQEDVAFRNREISTGEFVHFWSTAANADLRYRALLAFGWTKEFKKQFQLARETFPFFNYTDTFTNSSSFFPKNRCSARSSYFTNCTEFFHVEQQVAFIIDARLNNSTFLLIKPVAKAWSYVSETYGPLGLDPYFYIRLHSTTEGERFNCFKNRKRNSNLPATAYLSRFTRIPYEGHGDHFYELTCSIRDDYNHQNAVLNQIVNIVEYLAYNAIMTARDTGHWPTIDISEIDFIATVIYDIFNSMEEELGTLLPKKIAFDFFKRCSDAPNHNTCWMRNWFFPIYTHFKGPRTLNAFIDQINSHWPKQGTNYIHQLDVGEFVHFWSAVVNSDLRDLADKTFGWNETYALQYEEAKSRFPNFNYTITYDHGSIFTPPLTWKEIWFGHKEKLTLVKAQNDVALFRRTNSGDSPSWPLQLLSDAWLHVKQTYGPFSDDPNLHVILHEGKHEGCVTSTFQNTFNHKSVLDCGLNTSLSWNVESSVTKDFLVRGLATFVQESVKWPGTTVSSFNSSERNDWRVTDILAYDIYASLNHSKDFDRWTENKKGEGADTDAQNLYQYSHWNSESLFNDNSVKTEPQIKVEETGTSTAKKIYLFQDWYYPMYTKYGGTAVVQKFFRILNENPPHHPESGIEKSLSVGEFVHFWSGAVGMDLEPFGKKVFGLGTRLYRSIDRARRTFPRITYSDFWDPKEERSIYKSKKETHRTQAKHKSNRELIIGISIPCCLLAFALVIIYFLRQHKRIQIMRAQYRKLTPSELDDFFKGASRSENAEGNFLIESEPFDTKFEIKRSALDLKAGIFLGTGEYGVVLKGKLNLNASPIEIPESVTVAVKAPKPDVDVTTFKALLSELKVMGHIGRHDNVIQLLGAVTEKIRNRELFVVLEFCSEGDLLSYLRKHRSDFKDLLTAEAAVAGPSSSSNFRDTRAKEIELQQLPSTSTNYQNINNEFSAMDLLEWARQISNGMNFIGSKNVIHGDLAARNVLLTAEKIAKISDFGLSRQLVNYKNYTTKSDTPMPWRWMALESLQEMKFSAKSDVWAFGVTLFEIFSLGSIPYPGGNWTHEFVNQISSGYRLSAPKYGTEDIHELMMDCMKLQPEERPDFKAITVKLQNLKVKLFPESSTARTNGIYHDLNTPN